EAERCVLSRGHRQERGRLNRFEKVRRSYGVLLLRSGREMRSRSFVLFTIRDLNQQTCAPRAST
ncbi:MAG: hypothetical protein ACXW18_12570, partial [Pyrinomonadaceae bacterium]